MISVETVSIKLFSHPLFKDNLFWCPFWDEVGSGNRTLVPIVGILSLFIYVNIIR